jgi:putative ABC transport system permease protein
MNWTILLRFLPRDLRDPIAGDIEEQLAVRAVRDGRVRATIWAWTTVAQLALAFRWERAVRGRSVPPIGGRDRSQAGRLDSIRRDVVFSLRMLLRQPSFTIVALAALALGIGANTAIFSVVDAVLWRPLPYTDADRILSLAEQRPREGQRYGAVSPADFFDWRREATRFAAMAAFNPGAFNLTGVGEPERVRMLAVSPGFFDALAMPPVMGRGFHADEERFGRHRVVVLSDAFWRRSFGAAPDIVGRTVTFDGYPYEVVGVLPPEFWWPSPADALVPLALTDDDRRLRSAHFLRVIGRLRPGESEQAARNELDIIGARLENAYPDDNPGHGPSLRGLREEWVGDVRTALLVLLGAVGCVLLIACANVATLLLARAAIRRKELSIRRAIGATRGQLVRQLLTESLVTSLLGGTIGLLVGGWGLSAFKVMLPAQFSELPGIDQMGVDGRVLVAAVVASAATGVIFGVLPALVASDKKIAPALHEESRSGTSGVRTRRLRSALVVAELAFSLVLLTGAALLIVSFKNLVDVAPGFPAERLALARLSLPYSRYGEADRAVAFYDEVMNRLRATPDVQQVAVTSAPPFTGLDARLDLEMDPPTLELKGPVRAHPRLISSDYFSTLGIQVVRGRGFTNHDDAAAPAVAVINEAAARRYWPDEDPIGRRISLGGPTRWMEIVGIVGDVRHTSLDLGPEPEAFIPMPQGFRALGNSFVRSLTLVVRTSGDPVQITPALRAIVTAIDPQQPLDTVRSMDELIAESVGGQRVNFVLVSVFAVVALLLTAAGLYGVMAYLVAERTREIGVRMALGATPRQVVAMVLGQAGTMITIGVGIGVAGALLMSRALGSLLFGVSALDPRIYAVVTVLLGFVALCAAAVPSLRATRIDALIVIRDS